jgi:hypothetical protein
MAWQLRHKDFSFLLSGLLSFPGMVRYPIHLSLEEVWVQNGGEVLMDVDDSILLIVGDPQGILGH